MSASILSAFSQAFLTFPEFFQRQRGPLGPRGVVAILVAMTDSGRRSYSRGIQVVHELLSSGADLVEWHGSPPSTSAFTQARRKLKPEILRDGFRRIRETCTGARSLGDGLFHGLRRWGIDGTRFTLQACEELGTAFGYHRNQEGTSGVPLASMVLLWDISANQPADWVVGPADLSERQASFDLIDQLGPGDVLLADRGFPSFEFFHALLARNTNFIIRMNTTTAALASEVREFLESNSEDRTIECRPIGPHGHRRFPGDAPMRLRLVRDPEHGDRVLATNLLDESITKKDLLEAYLTRWNVETALREAKEWRGLENIRATFEAGVYQEVTALMIYFYLVAEMEAEMKRRVHVRVEEGLEDPDALIEMPYTFNRCLMGQIAVSMLIASIANRDLQRAWENAKHQLWGERSRKRKHRSNPRRSKNPHGKWRRTGSYKDRR